MTNEHEATRTLVKSPPELWAELSQAPSLTRHLSGSFGEIRITRLEPETAVAWEGERASGTVRIEPSGWGTRVTLTATTVAQELPDPEPPAPEPPEPHPEPPMPAPRVMDTVQEEAPVAPASDAEAGAEAPVEVEAESRAGEPEADAEPPRPRRRGRLIARVRTFFKPSGPVLAVTVADPASEATAFDEEGASDSAAVAPDAEVEPSPPAARPAAETAAPEPESETAAPEPEPEAAAPEPQAPEPEPKAAAPEPEPEAAVPEEAGDAEASSLDPGAILTAALDSLGQAHHRPFSRA